jgi:hypothetical protein
MRGRVVEDDVQGAAGIARSTVRITREALWAKLRGLGLKLPSRPGGQD